jgi:hypothetical protein
MGLLKHPLKQPPITDHQIIDLVGELTHLLIRKKVVVRAISCDASRFVSHMRAGCPHHNYFPFLGYMI